jgi:hypothetical protein
MIQMSIIECIHEKSLELDNYTVCVKCGKVLEMYNLMSTVNEHEYILEGYCTYIDGGTRTSVGRTHLKIQKSNRSKNEYTRNILKILGIEESVYSIKIEYLVDMISEKQVNRSKIKMALIVWCIFYIYKENGVYIDINKYSKELKLESIHITRANKIIIDIITTHYKDLMYYLEDVHPIDILCTLIPSQYISLLKYKYIAKRLYNHLEKYKMELFKGHTTKSIVKCIFYYILKHKLESADVNMEKNSEYYLLKKIVEEYTIIVKISKNILKTIYSSIQLKRNQEEEGLNER